MTTAPANPKPKRGRLQFSLASLGVFVTVVCVGMAWLAYERIIVRKRVEAIDSIQKLGGKVYCDESQPFRPVWLRFVLGDNTPGEVVRVYLEDTQVTDEDMSHVAGLTRLNQLSLDNTQITDAGLVHIAGLTNLPWLTLDNTQVTDAGLAHLAGLTNLEHLHCNNTKITDSGLVHVARLKALKVLSLDDTQVTDTGLVHFAGLEHLVGLWLVNTEVTDAGIAELKKALPDTNINIHDP